MIPTCAACGKPLTCVPVLSRKGRSDVWVHTHEGRCSYPTPTYPPEAYEPEAYAFGLYVASVIAVVCFLLLPIYLALRFYA